MRHVLLALLLITCGCASDRGGMTPEKFSQKCRTATLQEPSRMGFSNGDIVLGCQMKGVRADPKFLLFRNGKVENRISMTKVFAHLEDDRCFSFGAVKGKSDYFNCRTELAILRTQNILVSTSIQYSALSDSRKCLLMSAYGY